MELLKLLSGKKFRFLTMSLVNFLVNLVNAKSLYALVKNVYSKVSTDKLNLAATQKFANLVSKYMVLVSSV